jgi:protein-tyrosine phosphatase
MLEFVEGCLSRGESVLVHCLAGAHRAGTTGCILLMHYAGLPKDGAVATAQALRPVIQPIGSFPQLLGHVATVPRDEDGRLVVV